MKTRRERGDLIKIYKRLLRGLEKLNYYNENKILRPDQQTEDRRHPFQLSHKLTRGTEPRTHFLFNQMEISWNNLPNKIARVPLVNSFNTRLDFYLKKVGRNAEIYSYKTSIDDTSDLIS